MTDQPTRENPLSPAKGCILGLLAGTAIWCTIGVMLWLVLR